MFYFYGSTGANDPHTVDGARVGDAAPVLDDRSGKPMRDGYTRMAMADRDTGRRPSVGSRPAYPARPYEDHR